MRKILFRGIILHPTKRLSGWCYGDLLHFTDGLVGIRNQETTEIQHVISETVGQFTGLTDKNGKRIFEGDILSDWNNVDGKKVQSKLQVYWCEKTGAWKLDHSFNQDKSSGDLLCEELADFVYEITGNIYQRQAV